MASARTTLKVLLFASAREAAGRGEVQIAWPETASVGALKRALAAQLPALAKLLERCMIAVNQEYASESALVTCGDEVAVIPPVSGGAPAPAPPPAPASANRGIALLSQVVDHPIDFRALVASTESPSCGALVNFAGIVRDHNVGRRVLYLEYEGYAPMAIKEMDAIAAEVLAAHPGVRIALAHRIGRMEIGEASVGIATASAHRAEAYAANRMAIEELKKRVPIWKKEYFEGGAVWIETAADRT